MARTRAQDKANTSHNPRAKSTAGRVNTQTAFTTGENSKGKQITDNEKSASAKKRVREQDKADVELNQGEEEHTPVPKYPKTSNSTIGSTSKPFDVDKSKIQAVLSAYGVLPLQEVGLAAPNSATPATLLALVLNAMLTSARISHELAYKSVKALIQAGYSDIETLTKSSWQERTEVLTEGGYTRYREKTATALGELADFIRERYDGDLNNMLKKADYSPANVCDLLQEIKGIGKVGTDIFLDTAQGVWPCLAPFIDPRSMDTANHCGLGNNVHSIWESVGKEPVAMCKLAAALTTIRLEKKEKEFI